MAADLVVARGEDSWTIAGASLAPLISFRRMADGSLSPFFDESGLDPDVYHDQAFYEPGGCEECGETGFVGRTAVAEMLDMSIHHSNTREQFGTPVGRRTRRATVPPVPPVMLHACTVQSPRMK